MARISRLVYALALSAAAGTHAQSRAALLQTDEHTVRESVSGNVQ